MSSGGVGAFLAVAALVIVTPGPDTALTVRNALLGGRRGGIFTALGVATGQATWTLATSAGIAALLLASEPAFKALKLLGAGYLIFLGAHALVTALRPHFGAPSEQGSRARAGLRASAAFRHGLISNLGNPKMGVFFTSLLPQFVPAGEPAFWTLLPLGLTFCVMTLAWLTAYAVAVARAGDVLRRPRVRRLLDAGSGVVLVALGLRVAADSR